MIGRLPDLIRRLRRDRRGTAAAEFALTIPIFLAIMFGVIQVGILFFANAGLQNALGDGAREATLWPRKSETELAAEITASRFGVKPDNMADPVFTYGAAGGQDYVEISVSYTADLNFLLFQVPGITLQHSRRAYLP